MNQFKNPLITITNEVNDVVKITDIRDMICNYFVLCNVCEQDCVDGRRDTVNIATSYFDKGYGIRFDVCKYHTPQCEDYYINTITGKRRLCRNKAVSTHMFGGMGEYDDELKLKYFHYLCKKHEIIKINPDKNE